MDENCKLFPYLKKVLCCYDFLYFTIYSFYSEKNRVDFVGFNQYYLKEGCHGFLDRYEPFSSRSRHSFVGINPVIRNENDSHI